MSAIGFRPTNSANYRAYNLIVASILLVTALPIFLLLIALVVVTQGPCVFYRGERLGKDKKVFHILKIRTLNTKQAAALTKDKTLPADANIFTPLGRFLRDTRLDELPQILNIILGDMNICGPRPVRAAIRDIHVTNIPDYDIRFEVRPGLLGPTQAYFGHGASKRIRARMNNATVRRPVSYRAEVAITVRIIGATWSRVVRKLIVEGPFSKAFSAKRDDLALLIDDNKFLPIDRMDREFLQAGGITFAPQKAVVVVRLRSGAIRRAKVELTGPLANQVYRYEATHDLSAYNIERYALGKVVVPAPVNRMKIPKVVGTEKVSANARARA